MRIISVVAVLSTIFLLGEGEWSDRRDGEGKGLGGDNWVHDASPVSHFKYEGRMAKTTGFAHLIFNMNLNQMDEEMRHLCQIISESYGKQMNKDIIVHFKLLQERCKQQAEDYNRLKTLWSTNLHEMSKRIPEKAVKLLPGGGNEYVTINLHEENDIPKIDNVRGKELNDMTTLMYQDPEEDDHELNIYMPEGSEVRTGREKRQIIIGLIALIVSAASALYTATELSSISSGDDDAKFVQHLHDDEVRISVHDRDVRLMNKTLHELALEVVSLRQWTEYAEIFMRMNQLTDLTFEKWNRVVSGLEMLILLRLSPRLIDTIAMTKVVNQVGEKVKSLGYELDVEEVDDLYKFPVSYLTYRNSTVKVFVHIPVRQVGVPMDVYRFIKAPLQLTNGTSVLPQIEDDYLITDSMLASYMTMTAEEYHKCTMDKGLTSCPRGYVYYTHTRDNCLMSLFQAKTSDVSTQCSFRFDLNEHFVTSVGGNDYLIYHPVLSELELRCKDRTQTQRFQGSRLVSVPPGCQVRGEDFAVFGRIDIISEAGTIVRKMLDLAGLMRMNDFDSKSLDTAIKDLDLLGSSQGITIEKIKLTHRSQWWQKVVGWATTGVTVFVAFIVICLVLSCCRRELYRNWTDMYRRVRYFRQVPTAPLGPDGLPTDAVSFASLHRRMCAEEQQAETAAPHRDNPPIYRPPIQEMKELNNSPWK